MRKLGIGLLSLIFITALHAQSNIKYDDVKYDDQIGAITFHYPGQYFSYPILSLGSADQLELIFDDFSRDQRFFSYKVILCNKDWTPADDVPVLNYLDGYETNEIENNTLSFNTRAEYISHRLVFPHQDLKLKMSGNYLLYVWNDDTDEPVLTRRFMVAENRISVREEVRASDMVDKRRSHQEIRFNVSYNNYPINNPEREVSATLMQNGRWLDAKTGIRPRYARSELINFEYLGELLFPGGKEFRLVDTRSLNFTDPEIFKIEFFTDGYVVTMKPDRPRLGLPHRTIEDLNGQFAIINSDDQQTSLRNSISIDSTISLVNRRIDAQEAEQERLLDNALRADYCSVEFFLDKSYELVDQDVYVIGAFNGWQLNEENKMNYLDGAYYCEIELKQGIADYYYATTPKGKKELDITEIEGSSFNTRNEYLIMIYQRAPMDRHDRIIGFKIFNSFQ